MPEQNATVTALEPRGAAEHQQEVVGLVVALRDRVLELGVGVGDGVDRIGPLARADISAGNVTPGILPSAFSAREDSSS